VESNYLKRFLKVMEKLPGRLDKDSQIGKLLFNLNIDSLIPFHEANSWFFVVERSSTIEHCCQPPPKFGNNCNSETIIYVL
jgi:hypothetical protein